MKEIKTHEITIESWQELREIVRDMNNEINKIDNAEKYNRTDFSNILAYYRNWLQNIVGESDEE